MRRLAAFALLCLACASTSDPARIQNEIRAQYDRLAHEVTPRETWVRIDEGWKVRMVDQIDLAHRKRWIDGILEKQS